MSETHKRFKHSMALKTFVNLPISLQNEAYLFNVLNVRYCPSLSGPNRWL